MGSALASSVIPACKSSDLPYRPKDTGVCRNSLKRVIGSNCFFPDGYLDLMATRSSGNSVAAALTSI
jgi:hypothetical protein